MVSKFEWIIALLYGDNSDPVYGITKLEKQLFYFLNKFNHIEDAESFGFEAYRFGPHSDLIRDILYFLRDKGIIDIKTQETDNLLDLDVGDEIKPIYYDKQEIYSLTTKGQKIAEGVIKKISDFKDLEQFKNKFNNLKLDKLIRLVYSEFPIMTKNSEILDKYQ